MTAFFILLLALWLAIAGFIGVCFLASNLLDFLYGEDED